MKNYKKNFMNVKRKMMSKTGQNKPKEIKKDRN